MHRDLRPRRGGLESRATEFSRWSTAFILPAVEIVRIHTNPKRQRGNDLGPSLALRVSVSLNRGQYSAARSSNSG